MGGITPTNDAPSCRTRVHSAGERRHLHKRIAKPALGLNQIVHVFSNFRNQIFT
jgi:hypothetical protein